MTRCGQDRPRTGQHLVWPDPADHIHVITDANGGLSVKDARVLERLLFAKLAEVTDWRLRQDEIPIASSVGGERFGDLMQFGAAALRLLKLRFGLFGDLCERRLLTLPREHEPIIYDLLRNGPPRGEEKILVSFGIVARGIDLGEAGFVIRKGSQVRSQVVGSSVQLNGARREELFFGGLLERQGEELFVVRRDLWRPSATSAARFVSGSSASASAWHACAPPPSRLRLV